MSGVTVPKPIPYNVMVSPALAREVTTSARLTGSTYVSVFANSATTYCDPLIMNAGGPSKPGSVVFTVTVKARLLPPAVVTTSGCGPAATPEGTWTSTCPGLTKLTNAGFPATVTVVPTMTGVPPRAVGAWSPLKSVPAQVWERVVARL